MTKFNYDLSKRDCFTSFPTRKDFHHTNKKRVGMWAWYPKKPIRKNAARRFRRYRGDVSNGNWYRKHHDVAWILF